VVPPHGVRAVERWDSAAGARGVWERHLSSFWMLPPAGPFGVAK
jgi:hypothetical protein